MKRAMIPVFFAAACLCAVLCGTQVQAKVHKGKWKSNISWTYDTKTKVLTVSGSGEIAMSQTGDKPGWRKYTKKAKKVVFRGNITKIGGYTFWSFDMTSVELPDSLKEIKEWAFNDTRNLKKIRFPSGLRKIEIEAFYNSGLREVTIPSGVKRIGEDAFCYNTKLKKVTVSEGVEVLQSGSFSLCKSLTEVTLPDSLKKIEWASFYGTALKRITIPKNVETIGDVAFGSEEGKAKLLKVVVKSKKIKKWGKWIFNNARKGLVIEVPASKEEEYSKALQKKELPSYVKVVGKKELD